ncbi:MAG: helix-turn-helix domain-containing protein [Actinomycetota bacterium]|nr:helix-turn-helix domain-containing protein [Actinomycetota bacterium]
MYARMYVGGFTEGRVNMMVTREDPSALRWLIGNELRRARLRAGKTQAESGKAIGSSHAKINYLEIGKTQQTPDDVTALMRFYGSDVAEVDRLASLAGGAETNTWWAPFGDALPNWFKIFVGLEGLARGEFIYEPLAVPGQLQTEDYARGTLRGHLYVSPLDAEQVVRARMARQRVTDEQNPLDLQAVIEEQVLDRNVGGPEVMRAQLEHLLTLMERDNVSLQVMPLDVAVHDGLDGEFMILTFQEAQSIAYIEYREGAVYVQNQDQLGAYTMAAERLRAAALSKSDSIAAITARLTKLAR